MSEVKAILLIESPSKLSPADREKIAEYLKEAASQFQQEGNEWEGEGVMFQVYDDGHRFAMDRSFKEPMPEVTIEVTQDGVTQGEMVDG